MSRYVCVALVRLCLCTCMIAAWAAPLGAQSLADVARKEENRRKSIAEPGKVYTNKDLKPAPTPAPPPAAEPKTGDKVDDKGTDPAGKGADKAGDRSGDTFDDKSTEKTAAPAEPVRDQKYWVARLKAVQEQL